MDELGERKGHKCLVHCSICLVKLNLQATQAELMEGKDAASQNSCGPSIGQACAAVGISFYRCQGRPGPHAPSYRPCPFEDLKPQILN